MLQFLGVYLGVRTVMEAARLERLQLPSETVQSVDLPAITIVKRDFAWFLNSGLRMPRANRFAAITRINEQALALAPSEQQVYGKWLRLTMERLARTNPRKIDQYNSAMSGYEDR